MKKILAMSVVVLILCRSAGFAATLIVDLHGGGDYTDIQSAIDAAAAGDTVLVKPGEYVIGEPINFNRQVTIDPFTPRKDIIVRSEGGADVTTIRMRATPKDPNRASVVVFEQLETSASVLEGFTLTGGKGTKGWWSTDHDGGGVCCVSTSPTLVSCTISENLADRGRGGGVYCWGEASPTLTNCTISENAALWLGGGGGVHCAPDSSPSLTNCAISRNYPVGLWASGSSPSLTACSVLANGGSGVFIGGSSSTAVSTLTACEILGNKWCGVEVSDSSPVLLNCILAGNLASGIYSETRSSPSTFAPKAVNCTIAGNGDGGVVCKDGFGTARLVNCIVWGNVLEAVCGQKTSCLTGIDPLFFDNGSFDFTRFSNLAVCGKNSCPLPDFILDEPDYHIQAGSPAIDAGTSTGAPTLDLDGVVRPQGPKVDIGAYEASSGDCNQNGIADTADIASGTSQDLNLNHIPDECEPDCNGNDILDAYEIAQGTTQDCDGNRIPDSCDIASGTSKDVNSNGISDSCEPDCNRNGVPDAHEIAQGTAQDCDGNGIPDSCDLAGGASDCNANGILDFCDIASGTSTDVNANGIPDSCEPDCNGNGVPDAYEIAQGTAQDCDGNGIPDSCDIASGTYSDCNGNAIPDFCEPDCNGNGAVDECDIADGTASDCNSNGVPDDCDIAWEPGLDGNSNGILDACEGGMVIPGDANGDRTFDISDAVVVLGVLFLGSGKGFPCGDENPRDPANISLIDWQPDDGIDISDAVAMLSFLFLGGPRHALAVPGAEKSCVLISGCPDICGQ